MRSQGRVRRALTGRISQEAEPRKDEKGSHRQDQQGGRSEEPRKDEKDSHKKKPHCLTERRNILVQAKRAERESQLHEKENIGREPLPKRRREDDARTALDEEDKVSNVLLDTVFVAMYI